MNTVFAPYVHKFFIVFLDDILIYSPTVADHLLHLQTVLAVLRKNQLLAKMSKCSFAQQRVEYLGHVVSHEGVSTDPDKTLAMEKWPQPTTVTELRGFFGTYGLLPKVCLALQSDC